MSADDTKLVERLRALVETPIADDMNFIQAADDLMTEAASALEASEAKNAALTTELRIAKETAIYERDRTDAAEDQVTALAAERGALREALILAEGRIALLMPAKLPETDHPGATRYVLGKVRAALRQEAGRNG